jgi:hypothetical protein
MTNDEAQLNEAVVTRLLARGRFGLVGRLAFGLWN